MHLIARTLLATALAWPTTYGLAQTAPLTLNHAREGHTVQWRARTLDDRQVDARQTQGKVAVIFVWSTACAVCRTALPELRANATGWAHKPFRLVTLNVDAQRSDWLAYEQLVQRSTPALANMQAYWLGDSLPAQRLPLTLVLDSQGKVVARHEGRMAPQAWDTVAELLL